MTDAPKPPARPSVMSLSINSKSALYAAYMPFVKSGGLFIPTAKVYALGDEVFILLQLMDDPNKYPIAGKVMWVTPANAQNGKTQGIGIQFPSDESGATVKHKIEQILAGALSSTRPTHTL